MNPSLNRILHKTITTGFYKQHAGMLLGTFLGGGAYLFFIGVLNQTHFTHQQILQHRFVFILTLINSPFIAGLMALAWTCYTLKTWKYIATQLTHPQHEFLRYSTTAISLPTQRIAWAITQTFIMLPPIIFITFTIIIGIIFNQPLTIPLALLLFTAALTILSAYRNVWLLNRLTDKHNNEYITRIIRLWPKPYAALPLYQMLYHEKTALIITKLLTLTLLSISSLLLINEQHDIRTACLITITIPITNSILIYYAYRFESHYLTFIRNLPYTKRQHYTSLLAGYCILTLPESIWLIIANPKASPIHILIHLTLGITLRTITYRTGPNMQRFLAHTFTILIASFIAILFNAHLIIIIIPIALLYSLILFHRHYHTTDHLPAP